MTTSVGSGDEHVRPISKLGFDYPIEPGITIVVPVYNAFYELDVCIESLLAHAAGHRRILFIDDCSSDRRIWPRLRAVAEDNPGVEALLHTNNQGYTRTINHGCQLAGADDVVLLNCDTVVTTGWLEKLVRASESAPNVATVTPLSNAAGAFSVPVNHRSNRLPPGLSPTEMAELVEELSDQIYPRVPTGNGFCLFVRRAALEVVGPFDDRTFPHGCGEENDFCLRASRLGFIHLVDDTNYIFHHRSASLGWRKRFLLLTSALKLRIRYPEYRPMVAAWLEDDPLDPLRQRMRLRLGKGLTATGPDKPD